VFNFAVVDGYVITGK